MANLVGITNQNPNYDLTNNTRSTMGQMKPGDTQIQNIPDPTRVVRADARTDQQGSNDISNSNTLRYDSNLQFFIQQLRDAPDMAAELGKMMNMLQTLVTTPGLAAGVADDVAELLRMMNLEPQEMSSFLENQLRAGNRFTGPLFQLLRGAYQSSPSEHMHQAILNFVKKYSDYSSTAHIGRSMLSLLKQMSDYLPASYRGALAELGGRLENGILAGAGFDMGQELQMDGDGSTIVMEAAEQNLAEKATLHGQVRGENVRLLQNEIIPYLGNYIGRHHDLGQVREMLSQLMLYLTRYENGSEQGVLQAFRQVANCGEMLTGLNQLDDNTFWKLLTDNEFTQAVEGDGFSQQLAQVAHLALKGECGSDLREIFEEIVRATLINESVFMPLNHGIIPVECMDRRMYSEYWVDPDQEQPSQEEGQPGERMSRFLFKMDIQSLGYLEMTVGATPEKAQVQIYAPPEMAQHHKLVGEDIAAILQEHGFDSQVGVTRFQRPLTLTEVFPKLFEGKCSVNVKI